MTFGPSMAAKVLDGNPPRDADGDVQAEILKTLQAVLQELKASNTAASGNDSPGE
jgi:hypothetical protein